VFYLKRNLPMWERGGRLALAAILVAMAFSGWLTAGLAWLAWATAATLSMTAAIGFCPACAIVGRRPVKE
jgi:hypothetical protein